MYFDEHNGYSIRLIDQRPKNSVIQINIYNSAIEGNSFASLVQLDDTFTMSLDQFFASIKDDGTLDSLIAKAQQIFDSYTEQI
jgi:hypothetical protein